MTPSAPPIRCVVFDFDGTLVLSNEIKRDGFLHLARAVPGGLAVMERILAAPPGDRWAIVRAFTEIMGDGLDPDELTERYGAWCEAAILACPSRAGADRLLSRLQNASARIYINSATPEAPLRAIVRRRYGEGMFLDVLGGHGRKVENLRTIIAAEKTPPAEIAMIGDGLDDFQAAAEVGCRFLGVADGTLAADGGYNGPLVSDLWTLSATLLPTT